MPTQGRVRRRLLPIAWALALALIAVKARAQVLPPTTLYIRSDGLKIKISPQTSKRCVPGISKGCGVSDARSNTSWLPDLRQDFVEIPPMRFDRFGDSRELVRAALLAEVRSFFVGINLKIVDKRPPPTQRYSMVVVGGLAQDIGLSGSVAGLAPLDCGDQNPWDITFVFSESMSDLNAIARVVAQEAAHSYGIEHVSAPDFVMNPEPVGGAYGFARSCVPMDPSAGLSNPDGIKCIHACEDPSYQSAFQELRYLFGASELARSNAAPEVLFASLGTGDHFFETPATVQLDLAFVNAADLTRVDVRLNDSELVSSNMYPYGFSLQNLEAGTYEVQVVAHDIHGNQGQAHTEFSVGPGGSQSQMRPTPSSAQIQPKVMRLTGAPVRCTSDHSCYAGTTCQDGLCLRRPQAAGCALIPRPQACQTQPMWAWLGFCALAGAACLRKRKVASVAGDELQTHPLS